MRLEKIKLSGFKSFVDPTTIPLPVNLVGIVGPNGCGKSNIIDAVRWVMGESSAKNLRGGSMADVIFNGSSARKPISKASVELLFDNSDGALGGEYAQYTQLSIKRQVTRDGQSVYRLNGAKCRRRDITDIFLGTGLGARSYAIIEQGMISRLIEAKPEELRVFLEEAAGVSKYKERRHETEIRMRHTGENLERLNDLRGELSRQAEKLKRQVQVAERYKNLRAKERLYKRELQALAWQRFNAQYQAQQLEILQCQSNLEKLVGEQQRLDIDTDNARIRYKSQQAKTDKIQAKFYELGAEIVRIEQNIRHAQSLKKQTEDELHRALEEQTRELATLTEENIQLAELRLEKDQIKQHLQEAIDNDKAAKNQQLSITQQNQAWQSDWDQFIADSGSPIEQLKAQQKQLPFLAQQLQKLLVRQQRLKEEQTQLKGQEKPESLTQYQYEIELLGQQGRQLQVSIKQLDQAIKEAREKNQTLTSEIAQSRASLQSIVGRISALEKIIEHATGRDKIQLTKWLEEQSLSEAPLFIEQIEVENGWECAVEVVLSEFLEAICIDSSQPLLEQLKHLSKEGVALIERSTEKNSGSMRSQQLLAKVHSAWPLEGLLGSIYCVNDLKEAHLLIKQLKNHESVITPDGTWLGRGWLLRRKTEDSKSGVLQKEKELKQLWADEKQHSQALKICNHTLEELLSKLQQLETERANLQTEHADNLRERSSKEAKQLALLSEIGHSKVRQKKIQQELDEINREIKEQRQSETAVQQQIIKLEIESATINREKEKRLLQRDKLRSLQESANQAVKKSEMALHQLSSRLELLCTNESFTLKNISRAKTQLTKTEQRIAEIKQPDQGSELQLKIQKNENQQLMAQKMAVEKSLLEVRRALSETENKVRENSEKRALLEPELNNQRNLLEKLRISQEGTAVYAQTAIKQLKEQGANLQIVIESLQTGANESDWSAQIEQLADKIKRLGTVNLVAIDEYEALTQRMHYLADQHKDLTESLSMLEQAIGKIDRETKMLFKETFDKVNRGFQQRFPKLFGGGRAYLSLDDQDLLSTGVSVMASPPGKRNSTIHLLSGGEKALTAVALVFSIFDLNPAPFCLLDEVDAPLDDANVGRFSELVKEMSVNVQFLFISHNKSTMETAQHLMGVTMSEPGVSRMVSVDIDEAVKLAAL
jgi:chromosome segregation protein